MKNKLLSNIYVQLFLSFLKVGSMAIGGGYVILPMILREIGERREWCDEEDIMDYYTLAQSMPGMIAVNTATLIGYRMKKLPGAIVATLGMTLPSFVAIITIAAFFAKYQDLDWVQRAFRGIRAAVVATITVSVIRMAKRSIKSMMTGFLALLAFIALFFFQVSPFIIIVLAGILGVFYHVLVVERGHGHAG